MKRRWYKRYVIPAKYRPYIFNKYVFTTLGFLVWITFFDQHDLLLQRNYRQKINALKKERQYYIDEIGKNKAMMEELFTNKNNLERFAREKYYMKRDNEDVFVFVDENNKLLSESGK